MSRLAIGNMKPKELKDSFSAADVRLLLDETCIAELVHTLLCFAAFPCIRLWNGIGGIVFFILYVTVFQLPYIWIQRYNRPLLARVYRRMTKNKGRSAAYEGADTELQYGRRA